MAADNPQNFPELFFPDDARWASRAAARGEIRRLARGLYTQTATSRLSSWSGVGGTTLRRCISQTHSWWIAVPR